MISTAMFVPSILSQVKAFLFSFVFHDEARHERFIFKHFHHQSHQRKKLHNLSKCPAAHSNLRVDNHDVGYKVGHTRIFYAII